MSQYGEQGVEVFTIGHSVLSYNQFVVLLREYSINAIADVRTMPYSRHFSHFNREDLQYSLREDGLSYVFLGKELGGRPKSEHLFRGSIADYEKMSQAQDFRIGLERLSEGAKKYRIAMMCSEHDPLDCHRCLLVGRALHERGVFVRNIIDKSKTLGQDEVERRLMECSGRDNEDLFSSLEERLAAAYRDRASKVAFSRALNA